MELWINLRVNTERKFIEAWEDGAEYEADFDEVDFSKITMETIIKEILKRRKRQRAEEENPFEI